MRELVEVITEFITVVHGITAKAEDGSDSALELLQMCSQFTE